VSRRYRHEVPTASFDELIEVAAEVLRPHRVAGRLFGDVGAALRTSHGDVFAGVCIDTGFGNGLCAERAAIAAMVTAGQYEITEIVAVWRDDQGRLSMLPPCGHCREFIRQVDEKNLNSTVILGRDEFELLRDLLPRHEWPDPLRD
jgi:cytidine deaminase